MTNTTTTTKFAVSATLINEDLDILLTDIESGFWTVANLIEQAVESNNEEVIHIVVEGSARQSVAGNVCTLLNNEYFEAMEDIRYEQNKNAATTETKPAVKAEDVIVEVNKKEMVTMEETVQVEEVAAASSKARAFLDAHASKLETNALKTKAKSTSGTKSTGNTKSTKTKAKRTLMGTNLTEGAEITKKDSIEENFKRRRPARSINPDKLATVTKETIGTPWYMEEEGVTSDSSNAALGIESIEIYEPSQRQIEYGMRANVKLNMVLGSIKGITVYNPNNRSREDFMYVSVQQRKWESDNGTKYFDDIKLDRKIQAQILRYVDSLGDITSESDVFWYMKETPEFALVTDELSNPALGINRIYVSEPQDYGNNSNVIARVELDTAAGLLKGITVRESNKSDDGLLYIVVPSRSWEKNGETQYSNDLELSRVVQAQILRTIENLM